MSRRLRLMASRGTLTRVDDAGKMQRAQMALLAGEVREAVERFQQYGFSSVPLPGAEGVFLSLNGSRDQGVLISVEDRRYRPASLEGGESVQYNHKGDLIHIKADRTIDILAENKVRVNSKVVELIAAERVRADTPRFECTGDVVDRCDEGGSSMADMRTEFNDHRHIENNVPGGKTEKTDREM
ncbi:phage baseplate assembly protein V [Denitratisoma sp. agr-D3]